MMMMGVTTDNMKLMEKAICRDKGVYIRLRTL